MAGWGKTLDLKLKITQKELNGKYIWHTNKLT
jgi:hypothetical protein